mmetsp:Transcript_24823/g.38984  ORF Transcript_24823/g.38984 Transcript_24823/m.38984 type:complete len:250 (+) Transcript_24823:52-801(+)
MMTMSAWSCMAATSLALAASSSYAFQSTCISSISRKSRTLPTAPTTSLNGVIEAAETLAAEAADTWSIQVTPFLEPSDASKIEENFQDRGDVICFRVFGGRRLTPESDNDTVKPGEGRRSRFVIAHADLGMDAGTAEEEYCTVIRCENVNVATSNTFPNALASIGVQLDNVGDIVVEDSNTVCFVVAPDVTKPCLRLLSKELVGTGVSLSVVDSHEFMPHGEMQEMKLSRVLERQMERKKLDAGYVQFG